VPDAVSLDAQGGSVGATRALTQVGFVPLVSYLTSSGACYFSDPLADGQMEWNSGAIVSQDPAAGALAPRGSTVTLYTCAST
jgi:hypothetical protein